MECFRQKEIQCKMHIAARIIPRGEANYRIDVKGTAEQVLYNLRNRMGLTLVFPVHTKKPFADQVPVMSR